MGINANVSYFTSGQIIGLQYDAQTDIINFRSADGMLVQWKVGLATFGSWTNVGTSAPNNLITDGLGDVSAARGATLEIANGTGGAVKVVDGSGAVLKDFTGQQQWGSYFKNGVFDTDGKHLFLWDAYQSKIVVFETSTWQQVGEVDGWTGGAMTGAGSISPMQIISGGKGLMIGIDRGAQIFDLTESLKLTKTGGGSADVLDGAIGVDTLSGAGGADTLSGAGGNDSLSGGDGDDRIVGGAGVDTMSGGAGEDTFVIAKGDSAASRTLDRITDWSSADKLLLPGGPFANFGYHEDTASSLGDARLIANALIAGGAYNAVAVQVGSDVVVYADTGDDNGVADDGIVLVGRTLSDVADSNLLGAAPAYNVINGTVGADTLVGTAGADSISAGPGFDVINWSGGVDFVDGGDGSDTLAFDTASTNLVIDLNLTSVQQVGAGGIALVSVENVIGGTGDDVLNGNSLMNTLNGEGGSDTLLGGAGPDFLNGQGGNDRLQGDEGDDVLTGGDGADTLIGAAGGDNLDGGLGADVFVVASGESSRELPDSIDGWEVTDRLIFSGLGGNPLYLEATKSSVAEAKAYADSVIATGAADVVAVAAGLNVFVFADNGDDNGIAEDMVVLGGRTLADVSAASFGASDAPVLNIITGTIGVDTLNGTGGEDSITGLGGDDIINWSAGGDVVDGGDGSDTLSFSSGVTTGLQVNLALSTVQQTGVGAVTLISVENVTGGAGNDVIAGGTGANTLAGGAGDDTLTGGGGADRLTGGGGSDTFVINAGESPLSNPVRIADWEVVDRISLGGLGSGALYVEGSVSNWAQAEAYANNLISTGAADIVAVSTNGNLLIYADTGNDDGVADDLILIEGRGTGNVSEVNFGATDAPVVPPGTLQGTAGADSLSGDGEANAIYGLGGNDTLSGGNGNDTIEGDAGADSIDGGFGQDRLIGGAGADTLTSGMSNADVFVIAAGDSPVAGGGDVITDWSSSSRLVFTGTGEVNTANYASITSGSYSAALVDANILMSTGAIKVVVVAVGADTWVFADNTGANSATDVVQVLNRSASSFNVTQFNDVAFTSGVILGSTGADTLVGTLGSEVIEGGIGNDLLQGLAGNDTLYGGVGDDTLAGGLDDDVLNGGEGNDTVSYAGAVRGVNVNLKNPNLYEVLEGRDQFVSIENVIGGRFNDLLDGDNLVNVLSGGTGDDTLLGRGGTDTLVGEAGADILHGGDGADLLRGGVGADTMNGNADADIFEFSVGDSIAADGLGGQLARLDQIQDWAADDFLKFVGGVATSTSNYVENTAASYDAAHAQAVSLYGTGAEYVVTQVGADVFVFAPRLAAAVYLPWRSLADISASNVGPTPGAAVIHPPVGISGTSGNDNLTGTASADTINGLAGNDTLNGGDGADSLVGGLGVDVLTGGAGADVFTAGATALGGSKAGTDKITDFTSSDFVVMGVGAGALSTYTEIFSLNYNDAYAHAQALYAAGVDYTAVQVFTDVYVFALRTNEVVFLENASTEDISAANFGATYVAPNFSGDSSPWIFGTAGADTMTITLDHIQIQSGAGDDHLSNPTVWMSDLWGGDGNDTAIGSGMYDNIRGENGNDSLNGMGGGDMMTGGAGNDYMIGGAGTDIVWGQDGNDTVDGNDDMDEVRGGAGDDVLTGGTGEDWMAGDQGSDTLTGGQGPDVFYASNYMGLDRITDFSLADGDRVVMDPGTAYSVAQVGADTAISIGSGNQMILVGVQASSLLSTSIFQTWEWTI